MASSFAQSSEQKFRPISPLPTPTSPTVRGLAFPGDDDSIMAVKDSDEVAKPFLTRKNVRFSDGRKVVMRDLESPASVTPGPHEQVSLMSGCMPAMMEKAIERAQKAVGHVEEFVYAVWGVVAHHSLPEWLKDNEFLLSGHRPQLNSYWACFKSIFRIHTETGNIWTHLLGFIAFIAIAIYLIVNPALEMQTYDRLVFVTYCVGAILCLGFSWTFHAVCCHSEPVGKLFSKLDYCGISVMVMGSFVPWLYYCFYCQFATKLAYLTICICFGIACIVVSLWDRFSDASFRPVRAALFIAFGLSGVIPAVHYVITDGWYRAIYVAAMGWLVLMALLYIGGAVIYALRVPERIWPGKFDIWGQSHQIFHIFVIAAAFVHYHGITIVASNMLRYGDCLDQTAHLTRIAPAA